MDNLYDNNYLNIQNNQNQQNLNNNNDERKSNIMFNEIIDDLIRKKTDKENELKNQIEKNKKNLLEKFYSLAIPSESITNNEINNNIDINSNKIENKNKNKLIKNSNINSNNNNKNINIPNNINPNLIQDGQKEYDEIREKYKNERNKKKSSIFKSEDLRISNTNSVHLKKEKSKFKKRTREFGK